MNNVELLVAKLSKYEDDLYKANDELLKLSEEIKSKVPRNIANIILENHDLKLTHLLCLEVIKNYKENIQKLIEETKKNEAEIKKLKEENDK